MVPRAADVPADGRAVTTPVWSARAGDRRYVCAPSRSGKARRLRGNPRVEFADSEFDGTPLGAWSTGRARIVDGAEARRGRRALLRKYRAQYIVFRAATLLGRARPSGGAPVIIAVDEDPRPT